MSATFVYRSRATQHLGTSQLLDLVSRAQSRNRESDVTGLVIYDDDHFFQWLEGPDDGLAPILDSIRRDARHTDIEVLIDRADTPRVFEGWSLKLAAPLSRIPELPPDTLAAPPELIDGLHVYPQAVPMLLEALAPSHLTYSAPEVAADEHDHSDERPWQTRVQQDMEAVIAERVVPALHRAARGRGRLKAEPLSLIAEDLARLLIAEDHGPALDLIEQVCLPEGDSLATLISLFEPASRFLGDLWQREDCSELEVTLALCRMQLALRRQRAGAVPDAAHAMVPRVVVVPQPGELHRLGAALDSEVLWQAGWDVHRAFPRDDAALETLLARGWYDALVLAMSDAFEHDDWLPTVGRTIDRARQASENPDLVVVVSGRVFREQSAAGTSVHADLALTSSADVEEEIVGALPEALRRRFRLRRRCRAH